MSKLYSRIKEIIQFLTVDIWRIKLSDLPDRKAFIIKQQRIILLTLRGFQNDNCGVRASALTFYSLLSFVPVVAILFGFFKGFGLQDQLQKILLNSFPEHQDIVLQVVEYSNNLLENTLGGLVAGIGLFLLLWSVIKLLNSIEDTLNDIWKIKYSRPLIRRFTNYIAIVFLAPLAFIISSGATIFVTLKFESFISNYQSLGFLSDAASTLVKIVPYLMISALFFLFYKTMPNSTVNFKSAFIAALIAGTLYQITQFVFINFQVGVAKYNAIYGSFAAFPLFLFWVQASWIIFLFGAEYSFASQNISNFEFESDTRNISIKQKRIISLAVAHLVVKNFQEGEKALSSLEIATKLGTPISLVRQIIRDFVEADLFSRVIKVEDEVDGFQPAKDIDKFTIKHIIEELELNGSNKIPIKKTGELKSIIKSLDKFEELVENSDMNKKLRDV